MKRLVAAIIVVCMLCTFTACNGTENSKQTENSTDDETIKIGILFCVASAPSIKYCWETVTAYADTLPNVKLVCLDAELDAQKQADQALNLISQDFDVIVVNPVDASSIASTAKKINEAGIPFITYVQPLTEEGAQYQTCFIGADDTDMGYQYVEKMVELIGETGNIVLVEGALGSNAVILREAAIRKRVKEKYPGITILDAQTTNWDRETGRTIMEDFLAKYDDIDGVIAWDDNIAIGCIEALEKVGKDVTIPVLGYVGITDAIPYYESGALAASMEQPLGDTIKLCVDLAIKIKKGEKVEKYYWDPVAWITKDNLNEFTFGY